MAHLVVDYHAASLGMEARMHVLLPGCRAAGQAKTLYLLHGMSDNEGAWMQRTSIERYAAAKGLAVVMPDGGLGWYTDMYRGLPWFTFISQELPALCRRFFPILSGRREDTFIGGASMGGYGALKCGLCAPHVFSKAVSLSGALDAVDIVQNGAAMAAPGYWEDVFGPAEAVPGSGNDLFAAAGRLNDPALRPEAYLWCGTEDFLYAQNVRMRDHLRALGYTLTYRESPGGHQWGYWDAEIAGALEWLAPGEEGDPWR